MTLYSRIFDSVFRLIHRAVVRATVSQDSFAASKESMPPIVMSAGSDDDGAAAACILCTLPCTFGAEVGVGSTGGETNLA